MAVAVVTGASRGLGAGLAEAFAAAGVHLGLCARTHPGAPRGVDVVARSVDVTDAGAVADFAGEVAAELGPIELWVNNAGILGPVDPVRRADPAAFAANVAVNVLGVVHGTQAFLAHAAPGAVLVNISSGAGTSAYAGWGAYCASKAAVDRFTEVVALEEPGIRAYSVSPGVVDTDMQAMIRDTPAERFPAVDRFHDLKRRHAFNPPAWVARHLLDLAFGDLRPPGVLVRVPDQP